MATEELQATAAVTKQDHDAGPRHRSPRALRGQRRAGGILVRRTRWASRRSPIRASRQGRRDRVSRVLEQGRIRLVLTGTLGGDDEIGDRHKHHGDGVIDIALSVPDAASGLLARGRARRPRPARLLVGSRTTTVACSCPRSPSTATRATRSSSETSTAARSCRASSGEGRPTGVRTTCCWGSTTWWATSSSGHMEEWVRLLRARVRDDRDDPFLGRGDLDRVLGADVEGRDRRQRPAQVPDQRARPGKAQVADRRVPRLLQGRQGCSTSRSGDDGHREDGGRAQGPRRRIPADRRSPTTTRCRGGWGRSDEDVADLHRLGILVDRDDEGYLLQIFTKPGRATGPRCSSRSSSATARAASARATSRRCSRRSSASRS